MEETRTTVRVSIDLPLAQASAFEVLAEELTAALAQSEELGTGPCSS